MSTELLCQNGTLLDVNVYVNAIYTGKLTDVNCAAELYSYRVRLTM